ncbi:replication factor-a protein 1 [Cooperia oncophora]
MSSPVKVTPAQYRKYGVDGTLRLSTGFFQRYFESDGTTTEVPILQVSLARRLVEGMAGWPDSCLRLRLTDGAFHYSGPSLWVSSLGVQLDRDNLVGNAENGGEIIAVTKMYINPTGCVGKKDNAQGVFSFELTDKDGASIRITGFNEAAERAYSIIQTECSYYVAGGTVKQANKRFNTTGHDYELTINANTEIAPCHDQIPKPALVLKICPLQNIPSHKDEFVDVLAVVDKMEPVNKFISRQGRECVKRDLQLIDQTGTVVQFTLWGEQAENFEEHALGQVISIKGASVREWNGAFSLGITSGSKIELSPQLDEVPKLYEWYTNERASVDTKTISMTASGGSDAFSRDLRFIGTATALQLGNEPNLANGRYMNLKAMITTVKTDNALYQSCSNEGCSKKVVQLGVDQYRCEKCDTTSDSFRWSYMVQAELTDLTGSIWVTMFSSSATKVFGMEAQKLGELKEADKDAYDKVLTDLCFKYFNWRINAKPNTYNDETRMRYSVLGCDPVPYDRYIAQLEQTLEKLEQLEC